MLTGAFDNLDQLQHRLHTTTPIQRRADRGIDHDLYTARARKERARVVNHALRATWKALVAAMPRRTEGGLEREVYTLRARRARARVVRHALQGTSRGLTGALRRGLLDPVRRWHHARRTYNELMALDDRMLDDIGIRRGDIEAIARGKWRPHGREREGAVERAQLDVEPAKPASAVREVAKHREAA